MKPLIQSEAAECGLACLAMVAGHYGLHMDLPQMRRRFPLSLKGLRLNQLIEHAQQLGLNARALRLEMQDLGQLKLPCILHWDLNHFVVLARVGRKKAVLLDPASGRREMDLQEVSRHFTGVALELASAPQFRPQRAAPAVSLRQLTGPVRGLWGALAQVLLLSAALQVFVVLAPFENLFAVWTRGPNHEQVLAGDMGSALSGGQRQRLMLARALYRQPQFLFLDEATSHLDVACERQVSEAVSRLPVTRVIVAHRPETIASASRVLVMQGGRLQEATRPP